MAQHTHDVYDTGKCFEINGISRFIKETSSTKLVLVQGDHKSEVITFQLPRFIDGHDMILCNKIRVHYINIETSTNNKSADLYEVTDLKLCEECEDILTFTWTIEAPATKYHGSLAFLVKFECTEGDSILYQWNTAKYIGINVLDGIDNSQEFVDKYSNVLEEWYNKLTRGADSIEELTEQSLAEIEAAKENAKTSIQSKTDEALNNLSDDVETIERNAANSLDMINKQVLGSKSELKQYADSNFNTFSRNIDSKAQQTLKSIPEHYSAIDKSVKDILTRVTVLEEGGTQGSSSARIGEVTLLGDEWSGSGSLYAQVVEVEGVTENSQVDLTPSVEQLAIFYEKDITFVTENDGGEVTVWAIGQKPQNDYTIQVTITEVLYE